MIDGWPIAHHVFHGNLRDSTSVEKVLQDLQSRFGLRRVVFVGDRGMVTSGNLDRLRSSGQGYLVGLKRRRQPEILRYLVTYRRARFLIFNELQPESANMG